MALGLVLLVAYLTQKLAVGGLTVAASPSGWAADLWIISLIGAVTLCAALLRLRPDSAAARRLSLWLFAGFYLDEWVTRTTLKLWPLRLPMRQHAKHLEDLTTEAF
jgi:NAD(P)H-quinone oxidoreductase subunit 5